MTITLFAFLTCLFVYVSGENCGTTTDQCRATTCTTDSSLHCVDNLCTCLSQPTGQNCATKADCSSYDDHHHHHCRGDGINPTEFHCVDGRCRCRF